MSKSLEEVNESVNTERVGGGWKRFFAFAGPAYMVSVGYMDPGNWATDIAGGSKFGYSLLWVLLMSNLIALLLQSHCSRLGIVSGKDLAQASRENYPKFINLFLYFLAEIAIAACDLAEVVGMAIGLQLLFDIPLIIGICITVLDTFLLLFLLNYGIKKLEAFIIFLVSLIGLSFLAQMFFAKPSLTGILTGLVPSLKSNEALMIAVGIIGATVMPHNLYLHSSLVQTRKFNRTRDGIKKAIRFNFIDSSIALNAALFVNAAILILSASAFYNNGYRNVEDIKQAHQLLAPLLGTVAAPILFAVALIASGQSSTLTGTLAGQIVMEGYLNLRIQPWLRRMITRVLAIVPATLVIIFYGEEKTIDLLVFSQVVLSLQLGFAVVPLIQFVSNKKIMGEFAIGFWSKLFSWVSSFIIIGLNLNYLVNSAIDGLQNPNLRYWLIFLILPFLTFSFIILLYIILLPLFKRGDDRRELSHHIASGSLNINLPDSPKRILIAVDFSNSDEKAISKALFLGGKNSEYVLLHVVETAGAFFSGNEAMDHETESDRLQLNQYISQLNENGYKVSGKLGFGNPKKSIPIMVKDSGAELLIMGSHGHHRFKDLIFGTTVERVRHQINIPLVIV
ncbi:MAG: Nramp family divalent metal transporter [Bacteroidota bacterium]